MKTKDQKSDLPSIDKIRGLGTPSSKSMYLRLGLAMDEEQSHPYYKGKNICISKLANAMISAMVFELQRAKFEKENGKIIHIREVEHTQLEKIFENKLKELPDHD